MQDAKIATTPSLYFAKLQFSEIIETEKSACPFAHFSVAASALAVLYEYSCTFVFCTHCNMCDGLHFL